MNRIGMNAATTASGVLLFFALTSNNAVADPALRHKVNQKGDFVMIGNALAVDCANRPTLVPGTGTISDCGRRTNDTGADVYWRSDSPSDGTAEANQTIAAADARSTAVLISGMNRGSQLPPDAVITYARLYWGATSATNAPNTVVTLDRPGVFTAEVTADDLVVRDAPVGVTNPRYWYQATADVTDLVKLQGLGAYRFSGATLPPVDDVDSHTTYAGWAMVVLYTSPSENVLRNITLFDGLDLVETTAAATATLNGFLVPNAGFTGQLGVIAWEGDNAWVGDSLLFGADLGGLVALRDGTGSNQNNFFNSSRSYPGGVLSNSGDLPQSNGGVNALSGIDLDIVDITPHLTPAQTSGVIQVTSETDVFGLGAFIISISTLEPDFSGALKSVTNVDAHPHGATLPGDTLEYTIAITNNGTDTAQDLVVEDPLPAGVTLVPGSITVDGASMSDAAGDDVAEYLADVRMIVARVGNGADATNGGTLGWSPPESATITFRVTVDADFYGTISNQGFITYRGVEGAARGVPPSTVPTGNGNAGQPTEILVDQCVDASQCSGDTPQCDTSSSPRRCVGCLSDGHCPAAAPVCQQETLSCGPCTSSSQCPFSAPICATEGPAAGSCVECLDNQGCPASAPICDANACRGCTASAECPSALPACEPSTGQCVQCTDTDPAACTGSTPVCDATRNICVGCVDASDCGAATPACNAGNNTCTAMCNSDSECGGATPICSSSGICVACDLDAHCGAGLRCDQAGGGVCVECLGDSDCGGDAPYCHPTSSTCVGCVLNGQCPSLMPTCDATTNMCRECASNADCTGARRACVLSGPEAGQCVECTSDSQCPGGTCDLETNRCGQCHSDDDCLDPAASACDRNRRACVPCNDDAQCSHLRDTPACGAEGTCVECTAENDSHCPEGKICDVATGECVKGCLTDADCSGATPWCHPETGECAACIYATDCPDGSECTESGACTVVAVTGDAVDDDVVAGGCNGCTTAEIEIPWTAVMLGAVWLLRQRRKKQHLQH